MQNAWLNHCVRFVFLIYNMEQMSRFQRNNRHSSSLSFQLEPDDSCCVSQMTVMIQIPERSDGAHTEIFDKIRIERTILKQSPTRVLCQKLVRTVTRSHIQMTPRVIDRTRWLPCVQGSKLQTPLVNGRFEWKMSGNPNQLTFNRQCLRLHCYLSALLGFLLFMCF